MQVYYTATGYEGGDTLAVIVAPKPSAVHRGLRALWAEEAERWAAGCSCQSDDGCPACDPEYWYTPLLRDVLQDVLDHVDTDPADVLDELRQNGYAVIYC